MGKLEKLFGGEGEVGYSYNSGVQNTKWDCRVADLIEKKGTFEFFSDSGKLCCQSHCQNGVRSWTIFQAGEQKLKFSEERIF